MSETGSSRDGANTLERDKELKADTRPAVKRGVEFEKCLVFTARAEWGHFRRVDGNVVKQTYRVMPRTTVAGLCAAICGCPRDSYYDAFGPESSALAIEPRGDLRTVNVPVNTLSTAEKDFKSEYGHFTWPIESVKISDPTSKRQQHNYEVLVDPAYRIYVWLAGDLYDSLQSHLAEGTSIYTPSLGLSEYLTSITYEGERTVAHATTADRGKSKDNGESLVSSAVPMGPQYVTPSPGMRLITERSSGFMEQVPGTPHSRRTTGFIDWTVSRTGDDLAVTGETPVSTVDGLGDVVFV
jgi:CRISPR-associated protein Cas5h